MLYNKTAKKIIMAISFITMTKRIYQICAALIIAFCLIATPSLCSADAKSANSWLAYWDIKKGIANLQAQSSSTFDEIYFFAYALNPEGEIIQAFANEAEYEQALVLIKKQKLRCIPTVTNDVIYAKNEKVLKDPTVIHTLLKDAARRKHHIDSILNLIAKLNADGVDIDYEEIYSEDKQIFSLFIKELAEQLHLRHKTLRITVAQKIEDHQRPGAGAIDWQEISLHADRIIVMCYNYSSKFSKPGPICPAFWLEQIIQFARIQIPSDKICLALPLHGYDWANKTATSVNYALSLALSEKYGAAILWDSKAQAPYFTYFTDGAKHTVWFENPKSISQKLKIIAKYHINHIAFWHVSILDSDFIPPIRTFLEK